MVLYNRHKNHPQPLLSTTEPIMPNRPDPGPDRVAAFYYTLKLVLTTSNYLNIWSGYREQYLNEVLRCQFHTPSVKT